MKSKIQRAAIESKKQGYEYMSSVVKSVFNTTYYNVNKIDDVIENGWTPAQRGQFGNWHGRIGQIHRPEKCISRQSALRLIN
jgi:hypothetical protein